MKRTFFLLLGIYFLIGCTTTEKAIKIYPAKQVDKLTLEVDPTIRINGFIIYLHIPESILKAKFTDNNNNPIWIIETKHSRFGANGFKFGKLSKEYKQLFPENNELPKELEKEKRYILLLTTEKATYRKGFIFDENVIKITDEDKIEMQ